jgi:hypothetical protein
MNKKKTKSTKKPNPPKNTKTHLKKPPKKPLKTPLKKQYGGLSVCPITLDPLGPNPTSGKVSNLIDNIDGVIGSIYNTVCTGVTTVIDVIKLPGDMGKAYSSPNAPQPNNIQF